MTTTTTPFPPMDKISIIGIWIETVVYGVNCILYALCMFILLRGGKIPTLRWILLVTSTILFLLCTVHIGASVQQLLDAFVYVPADVPDYSTTYWLNYSTKLVVLKDTLYDILVFIQDFILIWRLYVVFMYDRRVIVFPLILEVASIGIACAATATSSEPNVGFHGSVVTGLIISAWVFDTTLNMSVTIAIARRLWWMGWTMASLTSTRTNRYAPLVHIVVDSGAIFAGVNIILLVLYALNSPAWLFGIGVGSQVAVLTPLLIVVQVGLTGRYNVPTYDFSKSAPATQNEIAFRASQEEDSQRDPSLDVIQSRLPSLAHDAQV